MKSSSQNKFNDRLIGILSSFILILFTLAAFSFPASAADSNATVIGITGDVNVASGASSSWAAARIKQQVKSDDRLKTESKSGAVVLFPNGSRIKVGPLSIVRINRTGADQDGASLDLEKGKVWAKANKLSSAGKTVFEIRTPTALCGVRGTEFTLEAEDAGATTVTVVEGSAEFGNEFGSVTVGSSEQSVAEPGKAPTPPKVVDTKNWIEWTFEIESMGSNLETPFFNLNESALNEKLDALRNSASRDDDCETAVELGRTLYDLKHFDEAASEFDKCLDDPEFGLDALHGAGMVKTASGDSTWAKEFFNEIIDTAESRSASTEKAMPEPPPAATDPARPSPARKLVMETTPPTERVVEVNGVKVIITRKQPSKIISVETASAPPPAETDIESPDEDVGRPDETVTEYLNGHLADAYFGLGLALLKEKNPDSAIDAFKASLEHSESAVAYAGMAQSQMLKGNKADAFGAADKALKLNPKCYQAMGVTALVELAESNPDVALKYARDAVNAAPFSPNAQGTLAQVYFFRTQYDEAAAAADSAISLDAFNPMAHEIKARTYLMREMYRDAVREALTSLALDEDNPYANDDLAMVYYVYRKYDGAILHWKKAIAAEPKFTKAKLHLARLYNDLEETETAAQAEKLAREVISTDKKSDAAWGELGRALEMERSNAEAEAAYLEAFRLSPTTASHLRRIASFYVARHKTDRALIFARKAVASEPSNPDNHFVLGRAFEAVDNTDSAQSAYTTALYLNPDHALARYQLGIIYTGLGKTREALSEMHTAALETPRTVTLAEYRGASRLHVSAGNMDSRFLEGVLTGDANNYKLNYRAVATKRSTDGWREINGESSSAGGSLLVGLQQNRDSSVVAYADYSTERDGVPGPAVGRFANDPDDSTKFKSGRLDVSYRTNISPALHLAFRVGRSMTRMDYVRTNDVDMNSLLGQDDGRNLELEFKGDARISDRVDIAFGGFSSKSKFGEEFVYEDIFDRFVSSKSGSFKQKNAYLQTSLQVDEKLKLVAGVENLNHNVTGSNLLTKFGADYRVNERSWLHFMSREYYGLSYHPRYQPIDEWTVAVHTPDGSFGEESLVRAIGYETRTRDGSFIKLSGYTDKSWQYNENSNYIKVGPITKSSGYRAGVEKPVSDKTNFFVAVSTNRTEQTDGFGIASLIFPITEMRTLDGGIYFFPNSSTTLKLIGEKFRERHPDGTRSREKSDYSLFHFQFRYDPTIDKSYSITVRNFFDKKYETSENFPAPGRTYELSHTRWF